MDTNYPDQNGQTPTQAPLAFFIEFTLFLDGSLNRPFSISLRLTMLLCFDVYLLYTPIYSFHFVISKTLCPRFQWRELIGYPFGISTRAIFKSIENNNHSRIIYRNGNIARLVKATITRCDLSPRFFCIDATLLWEFESDKI